MLLTPLFESAYNGGQIMRCFVFFWGGVGGGSFGGVGGVGGDQ